MSARPIRLSRKQLERNLKAIEDTLDNLTLEACMSQFGKPLFDLPVDVWIQLKDTEDVVSLRHAKSNLEKEIAKISGRSL